MWNINRFYLLWCKGRFSDKYALVWMLPPDFQIPRRKASYLMFISSAAKNHIFALLEWSSREVVVVECGMTAQVHWNCKHIRAGWLRNIG